MECCVNVSVEWKRRVPAVAYPLYILSLMKMTQEVEGGFQMLSLTGARTFCSRALPTEVPFRSVHDRKSFSIPSCHFFQFPGHFEAGPVAVEPSEGPSPLLAASVG